MVKAIKTKKVLLIAAFMLLVGLAAAFWFLNGNHQVNRIFASSGENVSGFAWSENIGWVSFNNISGGGAVSYGVNINPATGNLSGYAWSENIGWIQFNPSGPYPASPNYSVKVDLTTKQITGWARALAYGDGWDGWIKFGYGPSGSYIDANGDFRGWAWGSDVVGWVSLNHANTGGNLYKVWAGAAVFSYALTVTKSGAGTGSGTVTSNPSGINCGATCSASYAYNTSVTLTASADSGSIFSGWSGACSGGGTCTVAMTQARNVTATFNLLPPDFSLNSSNALYATLTFNQKGDSNSTTLTVTPFNGFTSNVALSVASVNPALPGGTTYQFIPSTLNQSKYSSGSQFKVKIGAGMSSSKVYTITVQGADGGLVRTVNILLNAQIKNPNWKEF